MERYLITQSLLSSWLYVHSCWEGCEDDAMADFLSTLRREPKPETEAMADGKAFEDDVYRIAAGQLHADNSKWEYGAQAIASFIRGSQFQVKASRELNTCGMTFLVFGILDALRAGTIFDVKYKVKSFGSLDLAGSYLDSPQHPFYFYIVPEAKEFCYLVSDGSDLYMERYTPDETQTAESLITEFIQFLISANLLDEYKKYWIAK